MKSLGTLLIVVLAGVGGNAMAENEDGGVIGFGARQLSAEGAGFDTSFRLLDVALGYRAYASDGITFTPELRIGLGLTDEVVGTETVSVENYYGFGLRTEFGTGALYGFVVPSYTRYEASASGSILSASEQDWEFGVGGGVGFRFAGGTAAFEVSYESVEQTDIVGLAFRLYL